MKRKSFNQKRFALTREKKLQKKHYAIIIALLIAYVVYSAFLEPPVIGHDYRYTLYIFLLPTLLGMGVLAYYRREFLIDRFTRNKGVILWSFMTVFYLIQGIIFSYVSFGLVAKISWDILNAQQAKQSSYETLTCEVTAFEKSHLRPRRTYFNYVEFRFQESYSKVRADDKTMDAYYKLNPEDYVIEITATKGLWNFYVVKRWSIHEKEKSNE